MTALPPLTELWPLALVIFGAYFIRGITGFGSGLLTVPVLAHFLPLQFVVPLILLLDFSASLAMSGHGRKDIAWQEIRPLVPFSILGISLGAWLLLKLPAAPLLLTLGILVILFGLRSLLNLHGEKPVSRAWAGPAGLLGGSVGAMFGTGGPPYVIYLTHRLHDKTQLRATLSGLFVFEGGTRIVTFIITGLLLNITLLTAYLACLPIIAAGLYLGHHAHVGIPKSRMTQMIGGLLLVSGASLIWKSGVLG